MFSLLYLSLLVLAFISLLQASQGSYSVDSESPLYKARAKLLDAVSSDPTNALSCYQLGRLCLLLGEEDEAVKYLQTALSLKPTHSEARYCLGLVVKEHVKPLLLHGLSEYLRLTQEVNENHPNPSRRVLTEINSKTLYRSSNPLVVCLTTAHIIITPPPCIRWTDSYVLLS